MSSPVSIEEAIGDMYTALEALSEDPNAVATNHARGRLYDACAALGNLARLHNVPRVADAVEALEREIGL